MNLSNETKVTKVKDQQTSAGTAVNSDAVDMADFEGVIFVGKIATANAANFAKVQQDTDSGMGSAQDLAGTKRVPADDGVPFVIDVLRPRKRYVRCVVDRGGANTATGDIYAFQYGARKKPTSHGATVAVGTHVSPAEGTA